VEFTVLLLNDSIVVALLQQGTAWANTPLGMGFDNFR
jgi:hypothetical protein